MKFPAFRGVFLASMVVLPSCGGSDREPASRTFSESLRVPVETVSTARLPLTFESVGTVRAKTSVTLAAKMMGQIRRVHVEEGDLVRRGKLLVEIDAREASALVGSAQAGRTEVESAILESEKAVEAARAAKEAAQANADLAATTYQRFQNLMERNSVSRQEFDQAEARYRAAASELQRAESMLASVEQKKSQALARKDQVSAGLEQAQIVLSYTRIEAPFSGTVTQRHVDPGDMASPGMPLLAVSDNQYRLEASLQESQLSSVEVGTMMPVFFPALHVELEGTISEIVPDLDPSTRTAIVKIDLPARAGVIPGMFGRARFSFGESEVLTVPREALVLRGQLSGVYVLDAQGIARFRLVKPGKDFGGRVEILSGLREQERIVTGTHPRLEEGVRIEG